MIVHQTFVIAGASLAGAKAAETLREEGFEGRVVLIGAEEERPYERPPLLEDYLRGETERSKTYVHEQDSYAENEIELRTGTVASSIDATRSEVMLKGGERIRFIANALYQGSAAARNMLGRGRAYERLPYFFSDQYELSMEYTGYATSWDELVFRGDPESREFVAFWLQGGRVAAAMNVNVWGVTDALGTLIRVREPVDVARLRNPEVPLDELASRPVLRYPGRSSAIGRPARELVSQGVAFARRFVGDRLRDVDSTPLDDLPRGEGRVVEAEGEKLAVFRDNEGTLHALSPVCTHLGCLVEWNRADQSWDCPCHGSRFDLQGRVIQGPARKELEPRQLPAGSFSPQADKEVP